MTTAPRPLTRALMLCLLLSLPSTALAEVELFALAGWPGYQRQTEVTGAALTAPSRFPDFRPQANPVYGGGVTWWISDHLGLRGDLMILNPNVRPDTATPGHGWKQRIIPGTLSLMGRWTWTDRLTPYAGIGLARATAKQCDSIGCTPSTEGWGAVGTVGISLRLGAGLSLFTEARHLSASFRYANIPDGALASDVHFTTAHIGLSWQLW